MVSAGASLTTLQAAPQGPNQILELFKMQYLMKFLESSGSGGQKSLFTILLLLAYDQLGKYVPQLFQWLTVWYATVFQTNKVQEDQEPLLLQSTQPPPAKPFRLLFSLSVLQMESWKIRVLMRSCTMSAIYQKSAAFGTMAWK